MTKVLESEWQGETNPGNYQGPEVNDLGLVTDNSDDVTHTPETPAERKKRKKQKDDVEQEVEKAEKDAEKEPAPSVPIKESNGAVISLEDLLNDPEFIHQLMAELGKYKVQSQIEHTVIKNLSSLLLEV